MKILFACLPFLVNVSYGQTVKLSELISKSSCKDFECYDNFITTKGFSLRKNATETGGTYYSYQSDAELKTTSNAKVTTRNQSIFIINNDGTYATGFGTAVKSHYQSVYNELAGLGFQKKSTNAKNDDTNTIETVFKSTKYPKIKIKLSVMRLSSGGESWTYYDFAVNRTP